MTTLSSAKKRFEALDSFRGICALMVVSYHARILLCFTEVTFFRNGFFFVEFFFILSGFVLFHTYGKDIFTRDRFGDYLTSRFFRIYPMHILMLFIVVVIEFLKLFAARKGIMFNNPAFTNTTLPSDFIPNLLLLQAWLPHAESVSFNNVSWSISVEFYIYILFGLILLAGARAKNIFFALIMAGAFLLFFIDQPLIKQEALKGLSCFFLGCFSYMIYERLESTGRSKTLFTVLELVLIILIVLLLASGISIFFKGIAVIFLFGVTVVVFAIEKGAVSDLLKLRPFAFFGKLSYSIYITHFVIWFCFLAAAIVATKFTGFNFTVMETIGNDTKRFITTHNFLLDQILLFVLLGVVILISNITYKHVESRGIAYGKRLKETRKLRKAEVIQQKR